MRVVTNEAFIQRRRQIAQISFFASMAILVIFFVLSFNNQDAQLAFYFNCVVTPALFLGIIFAVRLSNAWIREPVPWKALPEGLKGISTDSVLYHYIFPAQHLLVTTNGVFALYPIVFDRAIVVEDNNFSIAGGFGGVLLSFLRQENLGNPIRDIQKQAEATQNIIDDVLGETDIVIQPVIVFTHPNANVTLKGDEGEVPVTFALAKQSPTLKEYIKGLPDNEFATLTTAQIDELDEAMIYE
jgi:hypothetical protein